MKPKTITIIGEHENFPQILLEDLIAQDLQLLFISAGQQKDARFIEKFDELETLAELEFISCEKQACWEADVIILYNPSVIQSKILERIREVATQKTILIISTQSTTINFKALLPHSKVIEIQEKEIKEDTLNTYFSLGEKKVSTPLDSH